MLLLNDNYDDGTTEQCRFITNYVPIHIIKRIFFVWLMIN